MAFEIHSSYHICTMEIPSAPNSTQPSQIYFYRNRGEWEWTVEFKVLNFRKFLSLPLPLFQKFRLATFTFSQKTFGAYSGWTKVHLDFESSKVHHSTEINKWGICFYRSQKVFTLLPDGEGLLLSGYEFYWPLLRQGFPFKEQKGVVNKNTTSGIYQMPLIGIPCSCEVTMSQERGQILVKEDWIVGTFTLTPESFSRLKERFQTSTQ